ncbi:hypothetical protein [Paraburkholderia caballeronis]|uniref:Uncharacterized protein n=1 Tax=Paraburkholderia caballeronis TaxID=416943 RepID=A0A1H7TY08_9BURK|nr:hypothetical protein [Paraburkholderia caballeronis]PXW23376.1 hypothetical protein C7403_110114 [Paraburkholderia caballeronis]PXW98369.1 hypothetical protein C7407_110114 [Paraburkholderia caballeronis]RAJ95099.1 hypothetical protein C7409_110114 [Paraburkholderia caballeronis]SEC57207.1 hypothetical protein SAMN05445871_2446 [Paraburkholderia caballeronis]SEL89399.1 hypothetical protein SAMN05192542_1174 [Paraburkholderia caballeronis]
MSEFRFFKIKMKVTSVNVRQELHGDEHRLAMDIGLEFNQSNRSLDKLDGRLVQTFYWKNPAGAQQEDLEGVERVTDYPNLRFEHLAMPVKWLEEFSEGAFRIHHGDDGANDIVMRDVDINNIRFSAKEGGTTTYSVRIQCHPDEADVARVCTVLQSEVTGTIDSDPDDEEPDTAPLTAKEPTKSNAPRRGKKSQQDAFDAQRVQDIKNAMTSLDASQ